MEDGEENLGDLTGYVPTGEYRRIKEAYGDWVHSNDGVHLSGGVKDDQAWKIYCKNLAVMPVRRYNVSSRRVEHRFVQALDAELTGVWKRRWNAEKFILFQTVTLQRAHHIIK